MQLPASLRARIEHMLEGISTQELAAYYQSMSERYRRQTVGSLQIQNRMEALAYMASRLPATYGAVADVCARLNAAWPDFTPRKLLDLGAGPGTATLAACEIWPEIAEVSLVEPNPHLGALAQDLLEVPAQIHAATLQSAPEDSGDLTLLSYVLNEIPLEQVGPLIENIWNATTGALVVIEPGTPLGYQTIIRVRDSLLKAGAYLAAPCPHHLQCPLRDTSQWCHFSVRIDRAGFHRRVKGDAVLGYEDEKFSYLVATRAQLPHPQARVIGHPRGSKIVEMELCSADGEAVKEQISKRDPLYKAARKAEWGDGL